MRVALRMRRVAFALGMFARLRLAADKARGRLDDGPRPARILQQGLQERLKAGAVDDEDFAVGHPAHVLGRRLKAVWVDAQRDQRVDRHAVAGDVADDVGEECLGRQNCGATPSAGRGRPALRRAPRQNGQKRDKDDKTDCNFHDVFS